MPATTLADLKHAIEADQLSEALVCLNHFISYLEQGGSFVKAGTHAIVQDTSVYTKFAYLITQLFTHPKITITGKQLKYYSGYKHIFDLVFYLSDYQNSDHILNHYGSTENHDTLNYASRSDLYIVLIFFSVYSSHPPNIERLIQQHPKEAMTVLLALLASRSIYDASVFYRRPDWRRLYLTATHLHLDKNCPIQWVNLTKSWMCCSFADTEETHALKIKHNQVIRHWLKMHRLHANRDTPRAQQERPRLLIAMECAGQEHVMFLSFAVCFQQLATRFELIYLCDNNAKVAPAITDIAEIVRVDTCEAKKNFETIIRVIKKLQADIIFYPSVGMSCWGIITANMRLAPLQIFGLGHPASTHSDCIDAVILEADLFGTADCYTEKPLVLAPGDYAKYILRKPLAAPPKDRCLTAQNDDPSQPFPIAVPCNVVKINRPFLDVCKTIEANSQRPLRFHFFTIAKGVLFDSAHKVLQTLFPQALIYPAMDYLPYITELKKCMLHLSPFPFGGGNITIDSLSLGIPVVTRLGNHPFERSDKNLLNRFKAPDALINDNEQGYINTALHLIHNDNERQQISQRLLQQRPDDYFLSDVPTQVTEAPVADKFYAYYQAHCEAKA